MARASTKADLIASTNEQFDKLLKLINSMAPEKQNEIFDFGDMSNKKEAHWLRDKNIRDVLVHLYEWHQLLLNWVHDNNKGDEKPFLPASYNWKTYGQMNIEFWEKHQKTSFHNALEMVMKSHNDVMKLIDIFTNDELFTKKYFAWTGTSTLGSYCVSATSSHYDWAMKKVKLHAKS